MSEELKPCPFCGGEADVHYFAHDDSECTVMCSNPNCRASVSARSCGSMTTAYNRARKLWNRRTGRTCQIVVSIDRSPASYGGRVHRCSSCGKALPGALFRNGWTQLDYCPRCGARVTEMVRNERDYL